MIFAFAVPDGHARARRFSPAPPAAFDAYYDRRLLARV